MKLFFFTIIFFAVALEAVADIYFKKWSLDHRQVLLIFGMILYTAGTALWAYSLKFELLSKAITIFTVLNLIVVVSLGVLMFHEDLSTINKIGIALGVASVLLLQI